VRNHAPPFAHLNDEIGTAGQWPATGGQQRDGFGNRGGGAEFERFQTVTLVLERPGSISMLVRAGDRAETSPIVEDGTLKNKEYGMLVGASFFTPDLRTIDGRVELLSDTPTRNGALQNGMEVSA